MEKRQRKDKRRRQPLIDQIRGIRSFIRPRDNKGRDNDNISQTQTSQTQAKAKEWIELGKEIISTQ